MLHFDRQEYSGPERTIIVLGLARSGTSLAAQVLTELGVNMGEEQTLGSFEDLKFNQKVRDWDSELADEVKNRNERFLVWGTKGTSGFESYLKLTQDLRAPIFLIPMRDMAAILSRRNIAKAKDVQKRLTQYQRQLIELLNFIDQCEAPKLLYSHRLAIENPSKFVRLLLDEIGINAEKARVDKAIKAISPSGNDYLDAFYKNHRNHIQSKKDIINEGSVQLNMLDEAEGNKWHVVDAAAASILKNEKKKMTQRHIMALSRKRYLREIKSGSIGQTLVYMDDPISEWLRLKKGVDPIWEIRNIIARQQRFLLFLIRRASSKVILKSVEKESQINGSENRHSSNVSELYKLEELNVVRQSEKLEWVSNLTLEDSRVVGWCVNRSNPANCQLELFEDDTRIGELVNDKQIKSLESICLGVNEYGIESERLKFMKTKKYTVKPLGSDVVLNVSLKERNVLGISE